MIDSLLFHVELENTSLIWNPFGNPRPIPRPTSNRSRYAEWYEIVTIADEGLQILDLHWHYALHLRLLSIGKGSISCHICGVIRRRLFTTKKGMFRTDLNPKPHRHLIWMDESRKQCTYSQYFSEMLRILNNLKYFHK